MKEEEEREKAGVKDIGRSSEIDGQSLTDNVSATGMSALGGGHTSQKIDVKKVEMIN